jgi:type I restriction enzyme S subunit
VAARVTDGAHVSPDTNGGVFDFVSTRDLKNGSIDFDGSLKTTPTTYAYMVRTGCKPWRGDVLFSKDGTIGATALVTDERDFVVASSLIIITPDQRRMLPRFLNYAFAARPVAEQARTLTRGAGLPRLSVANLARVELPLPPLNEQRAIADYLDHETAQIDALVAKQDKFIGLLRERRLSQITNAFSGLGEPDTQLRRVAHIQTGVTLSGDGDPAHPKWPYLRVANVQMGRVELSHVKEIYLPAKDAAASMLRAGDVLMTEGGDIDKLGRGTVWDGAISSMVHQNHVFAVRANLDRLIPEYLAWWLDSLTARRYFYLTAKKTTNLASTNKTVVGRLPMLVPSIDEQRTIITHIGAQTTQIDALIAKAEQHIALAKERRVALLTAAVTGQIDVRTAARRAS